MLLHVVNFHIGRIPRCIFQHEFLQSLLLGLFPGVATSTGAFHLVHQSHTVNSRLGQILSENHFASV